MLYKKEQEYKDRVRRKAIEDWGENLRTKGDLRLQEPTRQRAPALTKEEAPTIDPPSKKRVGREERSP